MTDPVKSITFGGVKFNENDIQSKFKLKENKQNVYSVFLKNGVNVRYPEQPVVYKANDGKEISEKDYNDLWDSDQGRYRQVMPDVSTAEDGLVLKDKYTFVDNLSNAKITGSPDVDIINLTNSENTIVDVSNDDNFRGDLVRIGDGKLNEVKLGKGDKAQMPDDSGEIKGPGRAAQKDYK